MMCCLLETALRSTKNRLQRLGREEAGERHAAAQQSVGGGDVEIFRKILSQICAG